IIMVTVISPDHDHDVPVVEPNQHDDVPIVTEPVLEDEDEDPEEDEFEEEEETVPVSVYEVGESWIAAIPREDGDRL
ncbi:hypothetical protein Tco_1148712, partial [Tanacetum coccineum]